MVFDVLNTFFLASSSAMHRPIDDVELAVSKMAFCGLAYNQRTITIASTLSMHEMCSQKTNKNVRNQILIGQILRLNIELNGHKNV